MNKAVLILIGLMFAIPAVSGAKAVQKAQTTKSKSTGAKLQTDVRFDNSTVHGRYQTPDEAVARVENEKLLSDLLSPRKHFKDRLQTASLEE